MDAALSQHVGDEPRLLKEATEGLVPDIEAAGQDTEGRHDHPLAVGGETWAADAALAGNEHG